MKYNNYELAYLIQGGIPYEKTLVNVLALVIHEAQEKGISVVGDYKKLQCLYNSKFKITLPYNVIESVVNKYFCEKNGKYDYSDTSKSLDTVEEDNKKRKEDFDKSIRILETKFYTFYKANYKQTKNENIDSLFQFILKGKNGVLDDGDEYEKDEDTANKELIKKTFLKYLALNNAPELDVIESITITNSITKIKKRNPVQQSYKNCVFYLDTPVVLKYLGYDGKEYKNVYSNVVSNLIKEHGSSFKILDHSVEECKGVLYALNSAYKRGFLSAKGLDLWLKAKKELKGNEEAISLDDSKFESILRRNNIDEENSPELNEKNNIYDELKIENNIKTNYTRYSLAWADRIRKDAKSICVVQAIRQDHKIKNPRTTEDAKYFLLTDNRRYEKIAYNNYKSNHASSSEYLSEVLHIDSVIYTLWESGGKNILPGDLFRAYCLTCNIITDEFRDEFNKLVNRLERFNERHDLNKIIENNPDIIEKASIKYEEDGHSFVGVEKLFDEAEKMENESENIKTSQEPEESKTEENESKKDELIKAKDAEIERLKKELEAQKSKRRISILTHILEFLRKLFKFH